MGDDQVALVFRGAAIIAGETVFAFAILASFVVIPSVVGWAIMEVLG
jgi:hypothetical protein